VHKFTKVSVGSVPIVVTDADTASEWLISVAKGQDVDREDLSVRLTNAYCVALADSNSKYREVMRRTGLNFPDGTPLVAVLRLTRRGRGAGRVRGPSLFVKVLDEGRDSNVGHFFLGSSDKTLDLLVAQAKERFPGLRISGRYAPPFAPIDGNFIDGCVAAIEASSPDLVWVGLGTPKQDFASTLLAERLNLPCVGVGAAFDFVAGTVREAPVWMQRTGIEWIFRFASEPRRLWKRYIFGNARFLYAALKGAVKK
jgi:N-acetylglucosaminyldiphosphoundecaprenol N-acetyl-beta-D-mannosaminyltransferase